MKNIKKVSKRVIAFVISVIMILSTLPLSTFVVSAAAETSLVTSIGEKTFVVGTETEFTYTTNVSTADAERMVLGTFTLTDAKGNDAPDAVEKLEYWDVQNNCWRGFYGDFGPAATGFPLRDGAQSQFRVTFNRAGTYKVTAAMIDFEGQTPIVTAENTIEVKEAADSSTSLVTTIGEKTFVVGTETEFTYTTNVSTADAERTVLGTFTLTDAKGNDARNAVEKLEYWDVQNNCWRGFYGDFGPAATGFPLRDGAESKFHVTFNRAGTYKVTAAMIDFEGRTSIVTAENTITVIDQDAPVINSITANTNEWVRDKVVITVDAVDNGGGTIFYSLDNANWQTGNTFDITENGTYSVYVKDESDNLGEPKQITISNIDKEKPKFESFNGAAGRWTNQDVVISGTVSDEGSGVAKVLYKIGEDENADWQDLESDPDGKFSPTDGKFSLIISEDCDATYYFKCDDKVDLESEEKATNVKIDKTAPVVDSAEASTNNWTNETVTISGRASDPDNNGVCSGLVSVKIQLDGEAAREAELNVDGTYTLTIERTNYAGEVTVRAVDQAGNESSERKVPVRMDIEEPEVKITYDREAVSCILDVITFGAYDAPVVATISATDNFMEQGSISEIEWKLEGTVGKFDPTPVTSAGKDAVNEDNSVQVTIPAEFMGSLEARAYDKAGNVSEWTGEGSDGTDTFEGIVVDTIDPTRTVTFGEAVSVVDAETLEDLENFDYTSEGPGAILYYVDSATATIEITENNFYPEDVEIYDNDVQIAPDSVQWEDEDDVHKATITITEEGDHVIKMTYSDLVNLSMEDYLSNKFVIDNTSPEKIVEFGEEGRAVDAETLAAIENYDYKSENTGAILYYQDTATATVEITEANFRAGDVKIYDNGVQIDPGSVQWEDEDDVHKATITITEEGDHVIKMTYSDLVNLSMEDYLSNKIVVDKTKPVIDVAYANTNVKGTGELGRKYFDANQTATITIQEHNFRANDVVIKVYATDAAGGNVKVEGFTFNTAGEVEKYREQGASRAEWAKMTPYEANWRREDDTYKLVLSFPNDANYTLNVEYADLAGIAADSKTGYFTVDKTPPKTVGVKYSANVFENILNNITFGYYNSQMTVEITAEDDISGVNRFVYSYVKGLNVSSVNAELINEAIANAQITYNGKTATARFTIPKYALRNDNQFNGTIQFTAYDRSENKSAQFTDNSTVIVVDNINPTSQVTFNDPVKTLNNVSYYDGSITATVVIREANFYSQDVRVSVTKDGKDYPVNVNWFNNSVDVHTGTFTLADDGDYLVHVNYKDRSLNEMVSYTSEQMTIDTKEPVISVTGIKHQSANNAKTVTITVSVTDTNIALEDFKPILKAVIRRSTGTNTFTYDIVPVALGDATTTTNSNGETVYTYTISNLDADGFYSLVCSAVDHANHSVTVLNSVDEKGKNVKVEEVDFSVNREGSVFWIETEHNDKYTNETFTNQLNGAYANDNVTVRLHEINVDKVNEQADKQTVFTLNDGSVSEDIVLTEKANGAGNYEKNVSVGIGGWYENIYTLDNDTFDHDGVYSLNVITYDEANNSNVNTKDEAGTISFTLDRTNPVISSNIRSSQSINDTKFQVEFLIDETNLNGDTVSLKLTNNDGKVVETNLEKLGNNKYRFQVESGYNYTVEIRAKDLAGNESEPYKIDHFTVTTNIFILWYANTPLFWGSIAGAVLLAGMIVLFVVLKKRKKSKE